MFAEDALGFAAAFVQRAPERVERKEGAHGFPVLGMHEALHVPEAEVAVFRVRRDGDDLAHGVVGAQHVVGVPVRIDGVEGPVFAAERLNDVHLAVPGGGVHLGDDGDVLTEGLVQKDHVGHPAQLPVHFPAEILLEGGDAEPFLEPHVVHGKALAEPLAVVRVVIPGKRLDPEGQLRLLAVLKRRNAHGPADGPDFPRIEVQPVDAEEQVVQGGQDFLIPHGELGTLGFGPFLGRDVFQQTHGDEGIAVGIPIHGGHGRPAPASALAVTEFAGGGTFPRADAFEHRAEGRPVLREDVLGGKRVRHVLVARPVAVFRAGPFRVEDQPVGGVVDEFADAGVAERHSQKLAGRPVLAPELLIPQFGLFPGVDIHEDALDDALVVLVEQEFRRSENPAGRPVLAGEAVFERRLLPRMAQRCGFGKGPLHVFGRDQVGEVPTVALPEGVGRVPENADGLAVGVFEREAQVGIQPVLHDAAHDRLEQGVVSGALPFGLAQFGFPAVFGGDVLEDADGPDGLFGTVGHGDELEFADAGNAVRGRERDGAPGEGFAREHGLVETDVLRFGLLGDGPRSHDAVGDVFLNGTDSEPVRDVLIHDDAAGGQIILDNEVVGMGGGDAELFLAGFQFAFRLDFPGDVPDGADADRQAVLAERLLADVVDPDVRPVLLAHPVPDFVFPALRKGRRHGAAYGLAVVGVYAVDDQPVDVLHELVIGEAQMGKHEVVDAVERKAFFQIPAHDAAGDIAVEQFQQAAVGVAGKGVLFEGQQAGIF